MSITHARAEARLGREVRRAAHALRTTADRHIDITKHDGMSS
jgi:hypothetical protein